MRTVKLLGVVGVSFGLVACGGLQESDLFSATTDASTGGVDSAPVGSSGSGSAPSIGSGSGATGSSGGSGSGSSAPPTKDASTGVPDAASPVDTGTTPPAIPCGVNSCSGATPVCCFQGGGAACVGKKSDCKNGAAITCASKLDCQPNEVCCQTGGGGGGGFSVGCSANCQGNEVCLVSGPSDQCSQGTCQPYQGGYGTCQ